MHTITFVALGVLMTILNSSMRVTRSAIGTLVPLSQLRTFIPTIILVLCVYFLEVRTEHEVLACATFFS